MLLINQICTLCCKHTSISKIWNFSTPHPSWWRTLANISLKCHAALFTLLSHPVSSGFVLLLQEPQQRGGIYIFTMYLQQICDLWQRKGTCLPARFLSQLPFGCRKASFHCWGRTEQKNGNNWAPSVEKHNKSPSVFSFRQVASWFRAR